MNAIRIALAALALAGASPASAAMHGFLNHPSADPGNNIQPNSVEWSAYVTGALGLGINTAADFTTAPLGTLSPGFYQPSLGLTITTSAGVSVVDYASLPFGTFACPCSTGEGALPFSRMLLLPDQSTTVLSFDAPVNAVGFYYGDKFNPFGNDPTTIFAYDGPDGTGTLLATYALPTNSFQLGYQVFIGVASDSANIRSLKVTDGFSGTSDGVYIDNIRFSEPAVAATPEPASLALLAAGLFGLAARRRR